MRAVVAVLLLAGCSTLQQSAHTRAVVDETAHLMSDAAPILALVPGVGAACVVALKAACIAAETAAEWPDGPGAVLAPK
jgi:uncharacterized lipoprotein